MHLPTCQRMLRVQSPMIAVVGEMIKSHPGTISLAQGVVHWGPPRSAIDAAVRAAGDPRAHRYALTFGIDELIDSIRLKLAAENAIQIDGQRRIAVTAGANMGFLTAVLAIADPGDQIVIPSPFYFNHEMAIGIAACEAIAAPTDQTFQPNLAAIQASITDRTRAIVTISPNNPTGAVYSREALSAINALCRQRGIYHICDEAYEHFTYGAATHFSAASLPQSAQHTIALYSFSKSYGMAGWRVGYMVIPAHLEQTVKKIQDTNLICPPVLNQLAANAALEAGSTWRSQQIAGLADVRELVLGQLAKLGDLIKLHQPQGAFYAFLRLHHLIPDMELVERLIRDFGVAVMPGSTFGLRDGCYLRIGYGALDSSTVAEGIGRLVRGLAAPP